MLFRSKISELEKKYKKIKSIEEREENFLSSKANEITEPLEEIFEYTNMAKSGKIPSENLAIFAFDNDLERCL